MTKLPKDYPLAAEERLVKETRILYDTQRMEDLLGVDQDNYRFRLNVTLEYHNMMLSSGNYIPILQDPSITL